ncbi:MULTISPECIES: hypothetical protein [Lysinibacillus]|nr:MULTISPECIES: hypothetical protein [Lysinibacillus]
MLFEDEEGYPLSLPVWKSRSFADIIAANLDESFEAFNIPL